MTGWSPLNLLLMGAFNLFCVRGFSSPSGELVIESLKESSFNFLLCFLILLDGSLMFVMTIGTFLVVWPELHQC